MDKNELGEKIKGFLAKGTQASKKALEKAGNTVQDFSDKSVTKIEIKQLKGKIDSLYQKIGYEVFNSQNEIELTIKSDELKATLDGYFSEINEFNKKIQEKTAELE